MSRNGASMSSSNENHIKNGNRSTSSTINDSYCNLVTTLKRGHHFVSRKKKGSRGGSKNCRSVSSSRRQKKHVRSGLRSRSRRRQPKGGRRRDEDHRSLPSNSDNETSDSIDTSNDEVGSIVSDTDSEADDGCGKRRRRTKKGGCGITRRRKKSSSGKCNRRHKSSGCSREKSKLKSCRHLTCFDGDITDSSDEGSIVEMTSAALTSKPRISRGTMSKRVLYRPREED